MAKRESFLMRVDPRVLNALRAWAKDEFRSVNGQVEFILRQALKDAGRLPPAGSSKAAEDAETADEPETDPTS